MLRDIDTSKAAHIDRFSWRFLKDGANVLAKPVTVICDFSVSLNKFPSTFKWAALHKEWSFSLRISPVNVTKSVVSCGFGHIYWRNT